MMREVRKTYNKRHCERSEAVQSRLEIAGLPRRLYSLLAMTAFLCFAVIDCAHAQAQLRVFVTSGTYNGAQIGGVGGADQICNDLADTAGLSGYFKAWISNEGNSDPLDRFDQGAVEYQLVNGTKVADDWADLVSCTGSCLDAGINLDEDGNAPSGTRAWTDVRSDGGDDTGGNCSDWMAGTAGFNGQYGIIGATDSTWTDSSGGVPCNNTYHLYCVQQLDPAAAGPDDKTVFVTSNTYTGGQLQGHGGADSLCQQAAVSAGLSGPFRAWLATQGESDPENKFSQSTTPYRRTDGVKVADDYTDLTDCGSGSGGCLDAAILYDEFGTLVSGLERVWTSVQSSGADSSNDCTQWTSNSNGFTGDVGITGAIHDDWTNFDTADTCDLANRLYCLEQDGLNGPISAFGNCISPDGSPGEILYNDDVNIMQYCNGQRWIPMGVVGPSAPTSGLVAHWKLDETSGSSIGDSAGSNTGTWTDGSGNDVTEESAPGKDGTSIDFDGNNDRVTVSPDASINDLPTGTGMTAAAWVYVDGWVDQAAIIEKGNGSPRNNGWLLNDGNTLAGDLQFRASFTTTELYVLTNAPLLNLNEWTHVAVTWDGSTTAANVHIYVNGVESTYDTQINGAGPYDSDALENLVIGFSDGTWFSWPGRIDDVRLYNRPLSVQEIQQIYNSTSGPLLLDDAGHCWGEGTDGALGNGQNSDYNAPDPVVNVSGFVEISAGAEVTCGRTADGTGYCWGDDSGGQLGDDGPLADQNTPTPVATVTDFVQISASNSGGCHTCGVDSSGNGYCWGYDCGSSSPGVLGDCAASGTTGVSTPAQVCTVTNFVEIHPGGTYHSCGLADDGTAYCWGKSEYGRLGNNDTGFTDYNTPVAVNNITDFTQIGAGSDHGCGLRSNGEIWCWGRDDWAQLGDGGGAADSGVPVQAGSNSDYVQLTVGEDHSCGLRSNGEAWCWGEGQNGRLGDGATADNTSPNVVSNITNFASLSAGGDHTCGVTTDNELYCWGRDNKGQVGNGATTGNQTVPVLVSTDLRYKKVSAGFDHSCGINSEQYCSNPGGPEGSMIYNADFNILQYCNGTNWVGIGK